MSPFLEQLVVFLVMSILVALFAWIYLRDRQRTARWWTLGWAAILIHFAVPVIDHFLRGPQPLMIWLQVATLIIAGTFFLLSVSELFIDSHARRSFLVFITGAALLFLTGDVLGWKSPWFFAGLLLASNFYGVYRAIRFYGLKNPYLYVLAALVPYGLWVSRRAFALDLERGLEFYLCGFFFVTGVIYYRHFRRFSPGVVLTSLSFLWWGAVFPIGGFLLAHNLGPPQESFFWDLPKYFVAFGMLLTMLEEETLASAKAARQFQALFESNLAAVYVCSLNGKLLDCNAAFLRMYGFSSKQEALSTSANVELGDQNGREAFLKALERDGQVLNFESMQHRRDGAPFWTLERASIVTDPQGRRLIEGTSIDITERKHAEIALRQSEERFATLFRQSPVGCVLISLDGVVLDANENFLRMTAMTAEQAIGRTTVQLGYFPSSAERQKFVEHLRANGSVRNMEVSLRDGCGVLHQGLYFANFVWVDDKECIFGMLLDQTEQRELERKFLQAQKMEALGRLAGGVAHDFNNLLGVIGGYAELLEAKLGHDQNYARYCQRILDTTERASGLTQQLLTFSRKEIVRPRSLRPDTAIHTLGSILPRLLGEDIELVLDLRSTGTVVMDKTHFEQIILNIVVNARDAMPSGGHLYVTTEDVSTPVLTENGTVAVRQWVAIRIRDTGTGMTEETRAHAFEPFYTTKEVGRGTGLGLATVYGIVQQTNGEIAIDSEPGAGTAVSIMLPVLPEGESLPEPISLDLVQQGAGTILLVEDEDELRAAHSEFLTSIGYSVLVAHSGPEALRLATSADKIDLVITDVVMPKMNGPDFCEQLLLARPDTKVLYVSGYADDVVVQAGVSLNRTPFLQKPFSLKHLGSAVTELMSVQNRVSS